MPYPETLEYGQNEFNWENFVLNYEKYSRNIISKLDLNWEENIKYYNQSNRPVETASLHQVRGKILKNTSDHWKKYKEFLTETREILKSKNINF